VIEWKKWITRAFKENLQVLELLTAGSLFSLAGSIWKRGKLTMKPAMKVIVKAAVKAAARCVVRDGCNCWTRWAMGEGTSNDSSF
jgi:hypothetical protein